MIFKIMFKFDEFYSKNEKGESAFSLATEFEFHNILAIFVRVCNF